jgi:hypothetical protein
MAFWFVRWQEPPHDGVRFYGSGMDHGDHPWTCGRRDMDHFDGNEVFCHDRGYIGDAMADNLSQSFAAITSIVAVWLFHMPAMRVPSVTRTYLSPEVIS